VIPEGATGIAEKNNDCQDASLATRGAGAARGWFGFILNTAATFDVFPGLQITNYGLFNIPFESTPDGLDHADVCLLCIFVQPAFPPVYLVATFYRRVPVRAS
jgi:hypothetical protein